MHDFPDPEIGKATPYGVYDIAANEGFVVVRDDHDTAESAVATIGRWWDKIGAPSYPKGKRLLITADAGGSNGYRVRAFKTGLGALAARTGMIITVTRRCRLRRSLSRRRRWWTSTSRSRTRGRLAPSSRPEREYLLMPKPNVTTMIDGPGDAGATREAIFALVGEIISVSGQIEWIIGVLEKDYTPSEEPDCGRKWKAIKKQLSSAGLTDSLQPELASIKSDFLAIRNVLAHSYYLIASAGPDPDIYRVSNASVVILTELATIQGELASVKRGRESIQSVALALDSYYPGRQKSTLRKAFLLGRT